MNLTCMNETCFTRACILTCNFIFSTSWCFIIGGKFMLSASKCIHLLILCPILSVQGQRMAQFCGSRQYKDIHTNRQFRLSSSSNLNDCGAWEETGAPGRTAHRKNENLQKQKEPSLVAYRMF